jgi:hypothetical protein
LDLIFAESVGAGVLESVAGDLMRHDDLVLQLRDLSGVCIRDEEEQSGSVDPERSRIDMETRRFVS